MGATAYEAQPGSQVKRTSVVYIVCALACALTMALLGVSASAVTKAGLPDPTITVAAGMKVTVLRKTGIGVPRQVMEMADGSLLLVDSAGWTKSKGRILRVSRAGSEAPVVLFSKLDRPYGMALGPDGQMYIGETGRVFRFDPTSAKPKRVDVIGGSAKAKALPLRAEHLHPLTTVAFMNDGSMLVNFGSNTNNCADEARSKACKAATGASAVATVRRYTFSNDAARTAQGGAVYASGLRNSMGMVQHKSGTVLQIENSRDAIDEADPKLSDETLPHDEINVLIGGKNYGWPYCYDNRVASPEFKSANCSGSEAPITLLPAHSAPLGMTYWTGANAPAAFAGWLVITYHGYRDTGHRVVAFPVDASGKPNGKSTELIGGWAENDNLAAGGPVGITPTKDGALLLVDDRNGMLLELRAK
jgi:glucose/arabinose dehydrogenase